MKDVWKHDRISFASTSRTCLDSVPLTSPVPIFQYYTGLFDVLVIDEDLTVRYTMVSSENSLDLLFIDSVIYRFKEGWALGRIPGEQLTGQAEG